MLEAKNTINAVRSERGQKVKERKRKHAEEMAEALASKDDEWSKALAAQKIEADKVRVAALKTLAKIIRKRQLQAHEESQDKIFDIVVESIL